MNTQRVSKINKLISEWKDGVVYTSSWLTENGYSPEMLHGYKGSNWVKSVGKGAYLKFRDQPIWEGAVFALQNQLNYPIHIGGETALTLHGIQQNISPKQIYCHLYSTSKKKLPSWFINFEWNIEIKIHISTMFNDVELGLKKMESKNDIPILVSEPERAILEMLTHVNSRATFLKCWYLIEGMMTLRPILLQSLLESCSSVKVKRLFLFMADRLSLPWFEKLIIDNIDLGSGKRSIVKDGKFDKKYGITVPSEVMSETWI